jgi:transcriptional regulator with XRE-family HTH domain
MPVTYNESVVGEIRAEMGRQRVSQTTLARRLGWSQPFLSRRLCGAVAWDADTIEAVAAALDVPLAQLAAVPSEAAS